MKAKGSANVGTMNEAAPSSLIDAVVLGGGDPGDPFAAAHAVPVKPLIELAGKPMAAYVLEALRGSGRIGRVAYIGPAEHPALQGLTDLRVTDRGRLLDNLEAGVAALGSRGRVMVVTADIPLLTAAELRELLDSAPQAGVVYPIVPRSECEAHYPGVKRTYARLKEGSFTGGNLFLLEAGLVSEFLPRIRALLAARKNPLKLAAIIGPSVALRLLTGQLTIAALEQRVSAILGVSARALISRPSVGTDIDKEEDLQLAREQLESRGR